MFTIHQSLLFLHVHVYTLQVAVTAIRTALLKRSPKEPLVQHSSPVMGTRRKLPLSVSVDRLTSDLMNPSPRPSPPLHRRANGTVIGIGASAMNGLDKVSVSGVYVRGGCGWGGCEE